MKKAAVQQQQMAKRVVVMGVSLVSEEIETNDRHRNSRSQNGQSVRVAGSLPKTKHLPATFDEASILETGGELEGVWIFHFFGGKLVFSLALAAGGW